MSNFYRDSADEEKAILEFKKARELKRQLEREKEKAGRYYDGCEK